MAFEYEQDALESALTPEDSGSGTPAADYLISARALSRKMVDRGRRQAEEILRDANTRADAIVARAQQQAEEILAAAKEEAERLRASFEAARADGFSRFIVFLHYPPAFQNYRCEEILELLQKYAVRRCYYGHIHGKGVPQAFNGWIGCTEFRLVSADSLQFVPELVLP